MFCVPLCRSTNHRVRGLVSTSHLTFLVSGSENGAGPWKTSLQGSAIPGKFKGANALLKSNKKS
jgi:hypothetical protein